MENATDFIVVGSGIAGLRAAVALAQTGKVTVLTKDRVTESNPEYAQGGVAVALSEDDAIELHYQDTIDAGAGLCDPEAVAVLVEQGPRYINELIGHGAEFDREDGELAFTREAARSRSRVLHARGDATGREIVASRARRCYRPRNSPLPCCLVKDISNYLTPSARLYSIADRKRRSEERRGGE